MTTRKKKLSDLEVVNALAALAQLSRLGVFRQLVVMGSKGMCPSELAEAVGAAPNTLSFHLKELLVRDLISQEREGRNIRYRANMGQMQRLMAYLLDNCCEGAFCLPDAFECAPLTKSRKGKLEQARVALPNAKA